jgi:hypothetical protein
MGQMAVQGIDHLFHIHKPKKITLETINFIFMLPTQSNQRVYYFHVTDFDL